MKYDSLTVYQIVDAFREEALFIGPTEIKRITRKLKPIQEQIKFIEDYYGDDDNKEIALMLLRFNVVNFQPEIAKLTKYLPMLKKIIALAKKPTEEIKKQPIEQHDIDKAKEAPIESLYQFEKVKRAGRRIYACCPFHVDKSPSFFIDQHNKCHCFSCNFHGSSIDLQMKLNGCTFIDAVKQLNGA